jgi:hypothetical protein
MKRNPRTPVEATVHLAAIQIGVTTSPAAKGYEVAVMANDPKSETAWLPLPLERPIVFQVGQSASRKKIVPTEFHVKLRNTPYGYPNFDPSAVPTSVYWQGQLSGSTNFVFMLPKG